MDQGNQNPETMDQENQEQKEIQHQIYGVLVIGPSGSGKSTLCDGLDQFLTSIKRPHAIINLDPANDNIKYDCDINISSLIQLDEVQKELELGPNGG